MKKTDLSQFKETDIYSISMFLLYQLTEIPEYSVISELPYVVDMKSMLRLCQYFGGKTIKIPTLDELQSLTHLLLLYQNVNINGMDFNASARLMGYDNTQLKTLKSRYNNICEIMSKYNIMGKEKHE